MMNWVSLIFVFILFPVTSLFADGSAIAKPYYSERPEFKKFVTYVREMDDRCNALGVIYWSRPSSPKELAKHSNGRQKALMCIGDIVTKAKTINEQHGCSAFILNAEQRRIYPFMDDIGVNTVKGIACADGGLEKVLKQILSKGVGRPSRVEDMFVSVGGKEFDVFQEPILVFAQNEKYKAWFVEEKRKREKTAKLKFPKMKSSGELDDYADRPEDLVSGDPLIN